MTGPKYYYNGDVAEIQLYDRALTPSEIVNVGEILAGNYDISGQAGAIAVWGSNSSGQTNVPFSLTNALAVASGSQSTFNIGLQNNGAVTAWGSNNQGQTNVPASLTNVAQISAGGTFGLAIGNQAPLANNLTVSGYENHDLALALSGTDPDGNSLNFNIASLPPVGQLYQYSGGTRGSPIYAANTVVTDPEGRVIFAPVSGGTGAPYASFNFEAQDQLYSSATAQVTINIGLPTIPQLGNFSWNASASNEAFTLNFTGSSNATYSVWSSTNLENWVDIGTAMEGEPGLYQFIDTTVTNSPQQFYRISAP
jgi:hypothetical protein